MLSRLPREKCWACSLLTAEDLSHDSVNRFLLRERDESKDLFDEVKWHTNCIFYGYIMERWRSKVMTMHVNLSPEMEGYIKGKVASGYYGNATEVILDAIRRMQSEDDRVSAWRAAIAKGEAQLDRGEGVAYTSELMENITQSAIKAMHSDQPISPDVLP